MGATNFIRELTARYLDLRSGRQQELREEEQGPADKIEDSYLKNYREMPRTRYSSKPAYHLEGNYLPLGGESVIHGRVNIRDLKQACRARKVSVTKYLTASLIWSICQVYICLLYTSSAPQTTVADELKENLEAVENFKGSRDEKLVVLYCKQLGINYKNLSDEEFRWLIRILKKSKKMGTPISQRKKR